MSSRELQSGQQSLFNDALKLITNQIFVMILVFISGVIIARQLGTSGKGTLATLQVYPAMFIALANLGVRQSSIFYIGKKLIPIEQVVGATLILVIFLGLPGIIISAVLISSTQLDELNTVIIILAVSVVPFTLIKGYMSGALLGRRFISAFTKIEKIAALLRFVSIIIFVWFLAWGITGALFANLLAVFLVAIYALWCVRNIVPLKISFNFEVIKLLVSKGIVYAIALFIMTLNYKVDVVMLEKLSNVTELGVYSVAVTITNLTWTVPQTITTALFSHSADAKEAKAFSHRIAKLFRVTIVVGLGFSVFLSCIAPWLIPLVYGDEFMNSILALQLLMPGVFFMITFKILNMDLAGQGRPGISMLVTIPAVLINVIFNYFLIPKYGAFGASIASSISYSVIGVGITIIFQRVSGVPYSKLLIIKRQDFNFLYSLKIKLCGS